MRTALRLLLVILVLKLLVGTVFRAGEGFLATLFGVATRGLEVAERNFPR